MLTRTREHKSSRRRSRAGMTLIEVAIAMPIVVIALGMFVQMMTAGAGMRTEARDD